MNEASIAQFGRDLVCIDWAFLYPLSVDQAVQAMDDCLSEAYHRNFPEVTRTIKSTDAPWMTLKIRKLVHKKRKCFRKEKKSQKWRAMEATTQREIKAAQKHYIGKVKQAVVESGNSGAFFRMVNKIKAKEAPVQWNVSKLFPGLSDKAVPDKCVEFFSEISRQYPPIAEPEENFAPAWPIELHEIANRLKHCKKTKSTVDGDIHPSLVTRFSDLIAVPLYCIFNKVLTCARWPTKWKTVKILPKTAIPQSLKEVRNISCTPLFSKVLEFFLLQKLKEFVKLTSSQFGGISGVGIDHFLFETWHEVLMNLEDESAASNLVSHVNTFVFRLELIYFTVESSYVTY